MGIADVGADPARQPWAGIGLPSHDPARVSVTADVDVGGRKIHLSCLGSAAGGAPTVVLESGLGDGAQAWNPVFYGIAAMTRVCAYDRAGLGASDPAPGQPRTTARQVADLHAALAGAGVSAPYVLGGHSLGAWNISIYASTYPNEVAGLVFVDPRGPGVSAKARCLAAGRLRRTQAIAANRDELTTGETDPSLNPEGMDLRTSEEQAIKVLVAGQLFGNRPVIVLGDGRTKEVWADLPADVRKVFDNVWLDEQKALAGESTRGTFKLVPGSGHDLVGEFPDEVVRAVKDLLAQVGKPCLPCVCSRAASTVASSTSAPATSADGLSGCRDNDLVVIVAYVDSSSPKSQTKRAAAIIS